MLGERVGVLGPPRVVGERLEDGHQVADRDALAQQVLENLLDAADGQLLRHELLDHLGPRLRHGVEQLLHLLAPEQLVGVPADHLGQVGDHHRRRVDHGVAGELRPLAVLGGDPQRVEAEGGLARGDAGDRGSHRARVDGELAAGAQLTARHLHALQEDHVLARPDLEVVADVDGRDDEAHLEGEVPPQRPDALDEVAGAPRPRLDQRHQLEADLELHQVERHEDLAAFLLRA